MPKKLISIFLASVLFVSMGLVASDLALVQYASAQDQPNSDQNPTIPVEVNIPGNNQNTAGISSQLIMWIVVALIVIVVIVAIASMGRR